MDEKKQLKTSPAQRRAIERYREKNGNKYATFSICLPAEEKNEHKKILQAHNAAPVDVWRDAIERLKAQPITPTESATPDKSPDGNTDSANV